MSERFQIVEGGKSTESPEILVLKSALAKITNALEPYMKIVQNDYSAELYSEFLGQSVDELAYNAELISRQLEEAFRNKKSQEFVLRIEKAYAIRSVLLTKIPA